MPDRRTGPLARPAARQLTILLLVLHAAGCAADFATEQLWLMAAICLYGAGALVQLAGWLLWLALALSWAVGLAALRWPPARAAYWALLVAIPIAHLAQQSLLDRDLLSCDGP